MQHLTLFRQDTPLWCWYRLIVGKENYNDDDDDGSFRWSQLKKGSRELSKRRRKLWLRAKSSFENFDEWVVQAWLDRFDCSNNRWWTSRTSRNARVWIWTRTSIKIRKENSTAFLLATQQAPLSHMRRERDVTEVVCDRDIHWMHERERFSLDDNRHYIFTLVYRQGGTSMGGWWTENDVRFPWVERNDIIKKRREKKRKKKERKKERTKYMSHAVVEPISPWYEVI